MKSYLAVTLISIALVAGCQPAVEQPEPAAEAASQAQDVAAITAFEAAYVTAFNAGDAVAIAELFTEDAIRMPPNEAAVVGKEAIRSGYQTHFDQFTGKITVSPQEIEVAGDWAFVRGSYTNTLTPKPGGETTEVSGKYLAIHKRQPDGSWKEYRTVWNSDQPLPDGD